ncbi:MAG: GspH/FimT family protein [Deltaproteobacteria bacterium]|nr:GspH/FimT family protein [Deltaproteobacteria bacterium]
MRISLVEDNRESGFTIMEVIVVIAIIGIMTAIAIPSFSTWLPNYRLRNAARDLYSNFQKAKITAIKNNTNCTVIFEPTAGSAYDYRVFIDADKDLEYDAGEEVITDVLWSRYESVNFDTSQDNGVNFANNDDGKPAIAFRPNGLTESNSGAFGAGTVFLINTRNKTTSVIVSPAGNIRIPN